MRTIRHRPHREPHELLLCAILFLAVIDLRSDNFTLKLAALEFLCDDAARELAYALDVNLPSCAELRRLSSDG